MKAKWRTIQCPACAGYGLVSDYGYFGTDFYGAKDCPDCGGAGYLFILPGGQLAAYPGGPFCGSWPGAYETAKDHNGQ